MNYNSSFNKDINISLTSAVCSPRHTVASLDTQIFVFSTFQFRRDFFIQVLVLYFDIRRRDDWASQVVIVDKAISRLGPEGFLMHMEETRSPVTFLCTCVHILHWSLPSGSPTLNSHLVPLPSFPRLTLWGEHWGVSNAPCHTPITAVLTVICALPTYCDPASIIPISPNVLSATNACQISFSMPCCFCCVRLRSRAISCRLEWEVRCTWEGTELMTGSVCLSPTEGATVNRCIQRSGTCRIPQKLHRMALVSITKQYCVPTS